jgi:SAM-dependent methyltransferase
MHTLDARAPLSLPDAPASPSGRPRFWQDILDAPAHVINLDARPERLAASVEELQRAGFSDVRRFRAVDASDPEALREAWHALGSPPFATWDEEFAAFPGKQGCFLSHLALWEEIVASGVPFACIFEDDILFHQHWARLAPTYFDFTPADYDILFLGSQIVTAGAGLVRRVPGYCTHAYLITNQGARRLRSLLLDDPNGVATIDVMLIHHQWQDHTGNKPAPFTWYAWDGTTFPDQRSMGHPRWEIRNTGLVFQDFSLGSDVERASQPRNGVVHQPIQAGIASDFSRQQSQMYDVEFYASKRSQVTTTARAVVPVLLDWLRPASVVDVGCGTGEWLTVFQELGVSDIAGVDGDWVPREELLISPDRFVRHDLRQPLHLERTFDLAISLETAEHLPAESAAGLVASLARLAPAVLFSAAIPFQLGTDHLNPQWPGYWASLFAAHDFEAIDSIRPLIWERPEIPYWYAQNTILYVRRDLLEASPRLREMHAWRGGSPLPLVHPTYYLWLCSLVQQRS